MQKYDIKPKIFSLINIVFINFIRFFIPNLKNVLKNNFTCLELTVIKKYIWVLLGQV